MRLTSLPFLLPLLSPLSPPSPRLPCAPRLQLFPDDDPAPPPAPFPDADEPQEELLTRENLVGFWRIFDEQASEDNLNAMANGVNIDKMFSTTLVLRADGQTSRGSDFPGGDWAMREVLAADGTRRKRISIALRSKLLGQEWKYDGLLFGLEQPEEPSIDTMMGELAAAERKRMAESAKTAAPPVEIRVVGTATKWDVSNPDAPSLVGTNQSFSMVKMSVDRQKLTPTIKPFSAPVDPESVKLEQAWRRERELNEEEDIRRAIADVKKAKADYGEDGWVDAVRPREGVDFWKVGEEPEAAEEEEEGGGSGEGDGGGDGYAA